MKNSRQILSSILIISLSLIICAFGHILAYGQNNGVSIDSIAYKDSENEQVRISVSFDNPNYEGDGTVICLLYNPDGRCEEVVSDKVYDFSSTKYVYVPAGYEKVRVFLWESIDNLKPLGKEMSLSFGDITKRLTNVIFDTTESDEVYETLPMGEMVYGTKFNLPSKDSLSKTGYILEGFIVNGEHKTFGEEITVGEDDIIITPVFTELSSYTVEYYHQNITDDNYILKHTYIKDNVKVGTTATAITEEYEGFGYNPFISNVSGEVLSGGALTLKVYYDRNIYKATFDTNGGENTIGDISGKYESEISLPTGDDVTKVSHILTGWKDKNGEFYPAGSKITLTEYVTFTACWTELSSYTVEYYQQNITDDEYTKSDSYTVNDIEVGKTVKAEDKTYEGFSKSALSVTEGVVLSGGALTLKVYYDRNIYKATFDTNGGGNTIGDISGKYESEITLPTEEDVTKDSHIFKGWKDKNGEIHSAGSKITLTEDVTFTACWTELSSYTVEYYQQNIADDEYTKSDSYTVNDIEVGKIAKAEDKTYEGFSKSELSVTEGVVLSGGALTLKVYYDRNIITIAFDTNGGSAISSTTGKYESEISLPAEEDVTKDSHIFKGWKDNNGKIYSAGEKVTLTENVTFTALWKELALYTVEYYQQNIADNGYTKVDSYTVKNIGVGTTVAAESKTYAGFTMNDTMSVTTGNVLSGDALVLKVYNDRNIITIAFDTNGGSAISSKTGKYESEISLPTGDDVTKASHILAGWKDKNGEIHPAGSKITLTEDVTFTAYWTELSSYTVEYYQQNIADNGYTKSDSYTVNDIEVGKIAKAEDKTYEGFAKSELSVTEGVVLSGDALTLKVYYDRILTKVTFDTAGVDTVNETLPMGDMKYGSKFNLPTKNSLVKNGYVLIGFNVNGASRNFGEEITVGKDTIAIIPVFEKLITYKIEYYRQNSTLDGYTLYKTDSTKTASVGTPITLDVSLLPKYSGYYYDSGNSMNILSAVQTKDGTVLKVYYNRLVVTVEYYRHNPYVTDYYLYETKTVLGTYENSEFGVSNLTLPEYPDYAYNSNAPESVLSGIATKDGLTLKIYYDLVIDETAQSTVIFRINRILEDLDKISFTMKERKVLAVIKNTMDKTIKDAEAGAYIFMEGYVQEYYGTEVDDAKAKVEALKESGDFDAFKSKLGQLRANDVEYLAKTMFGIDDIEKWV